MPLVCPVGQNLWIFSKIKFRSNSRLNIQNQVSGFSRSFGLFRSGFLAVVILQNFIGLKIGSCFCFKKFRLKFVQVSKIGFKVLAEILASKRFYLAKSCFCGKSYLLQSQVSKIGFKVFSKSFGKFVFSQSQFSA